MPLPIISRLALLLIAALLIGIGTVKSVVQAQSGVAITINGAGRLQTIDGFGVNANVNSWNDGELRPALDTLVDTLGASLFRIYIDNADWETVNDDGSPATFNWTYYNALYASPRLAELWGTLAYLNQKGISTGLVLNFMGPIPGWMGGTHISAAMEDEWVEMVASLVYYARVTRGLAFTRLAPFNEPNWDCKEGVCVDEFQAPRLLKKLGQRLDALGLSDIRLIAPETASPYDATGRYIPEMLDDAELMARIDDFALHSYAGESNGADALIKGSAFPDRQFWVSEQSFGTVWFDSITNLLRHIRDGAAATLVFKGYDGQDNHHPPGEDFSLGLLQYNSSARTYTARKAVYSNAQIFRFVKPGAQRVLATSSSSSLPLVAFVDEARGRFTVVGQNTATGSRTISGTLTGLPRIARLELYQTTAFANLQRGPDVNVTNGSFNVSVSGTSVFTLTASLVPDSQAPAVAVTSPLNGGTVSGTALIAADATDNVAVAGVQFLLDGGVLGAEDLASPYSINWNTTTTAGTHEVTALARDTAGNITLSSAVIVTVDNSDTVPPSVAITAPAGGATLSGAVSVTAAASDNTRVAGVQFLLDGGPLGAEVTTAPYAVSWETTATSNGPHAISARARDAAGNVATVPSVTVTVSNSPGSATGLVAAYGFNEATGTTTADASGRGHTATVNGATWLATGHAGGALTFDGLNDWVTVNDSVALDLTSAMTLEAWVRPSTPGGWGTVALKEHPQGLSYGLYASTEQSRPAGYGRTTADVGVAGPAPLPLNRWTHLAVTYDGSALRLFINGSQAASQAMTGALSASASPLRIGGNSSWSEYFGGALDDIRIYNRALSAAEIQVDMNTPVGGQPGDTTPPNVAVTAPNPNQTVSGAVAIAALASDSGGVAGVQFLLDGVPYSLEDTSSPYTVTWATTSSTNGTHTIGARARDAAGNETTSAAVTVAVNNVDTTAPGAVLTTPAAGATVSGTVSVSATASDAVGVLGVQFLLDGAPLGAEDMSAPYTVSWSTSGSSNGSHTLAARARDAAGNQGLAAAVTVTVSNVGGAPAGLVAAYGFEEGAGTSLGDASGRGHHGTISGASWVSAGRFGRALSFDGTNDLVTIADTSALDLTTGMTIEAWVRAAAGGSWQTVALKERAGGLAYALYARDDLGRPAGYGRMSTDVGVPGSSPIPLNTWTHIAVTYDGATVRLFINGSQAASRTLTGALATSSSPLRLGGNSVWGEYFAGLLDEVRLYNRALSAAEIQADMAKPVVP